MQPPAFNGDYMETTLYIRTQDKHTAEELKRLGFTLLNQHGSIYTFLNDQKHIQQFSGLIVTHTNKLEFGG